MVDWKLMDDAVTADDRYAMADFIIHADRLTQGKKVKEFETEWNGWLGSKYSLFVSSGSTANLLLVSAIIDQFELRPGDKVLLPACTWVTNVSPIIQLGLQPIFCDINLENYSFDLDSMKLVAESHPDIKLIFVTHLLGFPADTKEYKEILPNAIVIDDVCESHGASVDGKKIGADSLGATFSFYFGHHMTTIEGGMVSTNDVNLYDMMRMKRSHGLSRESAHSDMYASQYPDINPQFLFVTDGFNFRSTEINAVLGLEQLPRLDKMITLRNQNLKTLAEMIDAKYSHLFYPVEPIDGVSSFALPLIAKKTTTATLLKRLLTESNIESRPIVGGNLLRQPFLDYELWTAHEESNVDILHNNGIYIGNNHMIGDEHFELLEGVLDKL